MNDAWLPPGTTPDPVPQPTPAASGYPVQFSVDYPDRQLNRVSSIFRFLWVIPIFIVLSAFDDNWGSFASDSAFAGLSFGGYLIIPTVLLIVFRQKYPRWWFDFNLELMRFVNRISAYALLMNDQYPSTDDHQTVHLDYRYPDAKTDINRFLPLVKWLLAIPHFIVLLFLGIVAFFAVIGAWFAILFTGRYPREIFDYLVGVNRWQNRVVAYAFLMVTDEYPPFSLSDN